VKTSFWLDAIPIVKKEYLNILFIAEAYWDKEWELQQQGFDFTYDKRLYDRLIEGHVEPIRHHLCADLDYQLRSVRFLENHDEPRAAFVFPDLERHRAAATITYLVPGLRFFHDGQFEGRRSKLSVQLNRRRDEEVDNGVSEFYHRLLNMVLVRPEVNLGKWRLLECRPADQFNNSNDNFIAFGWTYVVPSGSSTMPQTLDVAAASGTKVEATSSSSSSDATSPRKQTSPVVRKRRGSQSMFLSPENSASPTCELKFLLVVSNYSNQQSQCFLDLKPYAKECLYGQKFSLHDIINPNFFFIREGNELAHNGLFLDLAPWFTHVFEVRLFQNQPA